MTCPYKAPAGLEKDALKQGWLNQITDDLMPIHGLVLPARDVYPVTAIGVVFQDVLIEMSEISRNFASEIA